MTEQTIGGASISRALIASGVLSQEAISVVPLHRGNQSSCFLVKPSNDRSPIVVKVFRNIGSNNMLASAIATEYQALQEFHKHAVDILVPCPLSQLSIGEYAGYAMTYVEGISLRQHLSTNSEYTNLIRQLLSGLTLYYASVDDPYGDFHAGNVLLSASRIALLDPTAPSEKHRHLQLSDIHESRQTGRTHVFLATDLGYWLYSLVGNGFMGFMRNPKETKALYKFTRELIGICGATTPDPSLFYFEVYRAAKRHAIHLTVHAKTLRGRANAIVTFATLSLLAIIGY